MDLELPGKIRKRVPESSLAQYDDLCARAMEAFAEHGETRMEYLVGFVMSFWVLTEYDRRRLHLSRWARGFLYHLSTACGRRLSPEELAEAEEFIGSVGGAPVPDTQGE